MIWCYFTVALSLMPAWHPLLAMFVIAASPSAFAPLLLLQAVGAWRGAQSICPLGFSAELLQFAGTSIRQILVRTLCSACHWVGTLIGLAASLSSDGLEQLKVAAELLGQLLAAALFSLSEPWYEHPAAHRAGR